MPKIIMMGGGSGSGGTSVNTWRAIATPTIQLPNFAIDGHGFGSDVYFVGNGFEFAKYTPGSNTWTALTAVPNHGDTLLFGSGFLTDFGGSLLYFTQESGAGLGGPAHTLTYSIGGNSWTETRTPCPQGLNYFAAGQVSGKVYVLAGAINGTLANTVRIYNLNTDAWTTGATLPAGNRAFGAYATVGTKIYCWFGGASTSIDMVAELWIYDTVGNSWSAGAAPPYTPLFASAQPLTNGTILLYGGQATFTHDPSGSGTPVGLALVFDPTSGLYTTTGTFPFASSKDCSAVLNGKVYGVAASNQFGGVPLSYVYTSAPLLSAADVPGVVAVGAQNTPASVYAASGASGFISINTDVGVGKAGVEGRGFEGVRGRGSSDGVHGFGGSSAGVHGEATQPTTYGVYGEDRGQPNAVGVLASSLGVENSTTASDLTKVATDVPLLDGAGNVLGHLKVWTPGVDHSAPVNVDNTLNVINQPLNVTGTGTSLNLTTDGGSAVAAVTSYGTGVFPTMAFAAARGSLASPLPIQLNDLIGRFGAKGAFGTVSGAFPGANKARIDFFAGENYVDSTHLGNYISFITTPNASGTPAAVVNMGISGQSLQVPATSDVMFTFGSSAGLCDTTISNPAMGWMARSMNQDRNEFGVTIQAIMATFSPTAQREKAALAVKAASQVNSTPPNNSDTVATLTQGIISNTTTTGRAWGLVAETLANTTGDDGLLIGAEIGVINRGSAQVSVDQNTSKYNIWLASHTEIANVSKATAGLAFANNTAAWQYGLYMRQIVGTFIAMGTPAGAAGATLGIDMANSANWSKALVIPNAVPISGYNSGGSSKIDLLQVSSGGLLQLLNGTAVPISGPTGTYTVLATDFAVYGNATTAAFTITLPAATGTGRILHIKKVDATANAITVSRAGADTIEGATTITLSAQWNSITLIDGASASWRKIAST